MVSYNSQNKFQTPVLFLIFNRLETTKAVFEQIRSSKPSYLYLAGDGARTGNLKEQFVVNEIRTWVLENINWDCNVSTLFRDKNLGCAKAVSSAIDWFFQNEEMGIILEDDCLPDESFFGYCEDLLEKYKDDYRIMHITGTNLLTHSNGKQHESYYFSKYANVWGWATWRRAWQHYDLDIRKYVNFREQKYLKHYFTYFPAYISRLKWYSAVLNVEGEQRTFDTWDYQWCFTCSSNSGLSIVPNTNLIKNIGFGSNATHTSVFDSFFEQNVEKIDFPLKHPDFVIIDYNKDLRYEQKIFGKKIDAYIIILKDLIRKFFLKRKVNYLKYL